MSNLLALGSKLTVTVVPAPPGAKVPLLGDTTSQSGAFTTSQFRLVEPALFNVYVAEIAWNGPPIGPVATVK